MKKTFLYAFAAIVLGISFMLFPLWTFFNRYNEQGIKPMYMSQNWQNYTAERMAPAPEAIPANYNNGQFQPTTGSSIPISLQILAAGFIIAIGAYAVARRKLTQSSIDFRHTNG